MNGLTDHASEHGRYSADEGRPNQGHAEVDSIEAYESDGKVVFYDARNPLAWVETTRAVSLQDLA